MIQMRMHEIVSALHELKLFRNSFVSDNPLPIFFLFLLTKRQRITIMIIRYNPICDNFENECNLAYPN